MLLLIGAHLHRMAHFGRISRVRDGGAARHHRALGKRRPRRPAPVARLPACERAEQRAKRDPAGDGGDPAGTRATCRRAFEILRDRLGEHRIVSSAQCLAETAVGGDALRVLGARGKPGFDLGLAFGAESPVGVGLQVGFRDGGFRAHFTTFSLAAAPWPSIIMRSFSRARDRRDITVPIGMPTARATSS